MDTISMSMYAGYNGFGQMPLSQVEELQKALTAGTGTDSASFTGGRALTVESLEGTLMTTTFSADDVVLWKMLKSTPVYAVVDEWIEKSEYGDRYGVAVSETGSPGARSSTYNRRTATVKFYRIQRELSHVMTLMRSTVDAEAEEQMDGTMLLLQAIEEALFYGDSDIITEEIDGLTKIITENGSSDNVIDVRGAIEEAHLKEGAKVIRGHFGTPTDLFLSLSVQEDVDSILEEKHRVAIPLQAGAGGLTAGAPIEQYRTSWGTFKLHPDVFITRAQEERAPFTAAVGTAPTAPTSVTHAEASDVASQFAASDAGTYYYQVSYFTASGESEGTSTTAVTVAAGDKVTLTINGGNTTTVKGVKIFRSAKDAADDTDCLLLDTVVFTTSGMTYVDRNAKLPGSSTAFLLDMSPNHRAIGWRQLLPMMKLPLAITGPSIPFLIMLYGYLRVPKPKQHVLLTNIRPAGHRFNV